MLAFINEAVASMWAFYSDPSPVSLLAAFMAGAVFTVLLATMELVRLASLFLWEKFLLLRADRRS
jgi:hypothetical protein